MRLSSERILVFDTETTGIDPASDRIVELGAAYFQGGQRREHRRMRVHPGRPIPPEASAIHGICDHHVQASPSFAEVGARFIKHLDGSALDGAPPVLCGYNAVRYDAPLVNAELARCGHGARVDEARVIDPFFFVAWHLRGLRSRKLTSVCEHYGVILAHAHSAAADALATGEVLLCMVRAGLVPDDVDAALAEQAALSTRVDAEWARWSYWLYEDRQDGSLRLGAGKHCGQPLRSVDPGYCRFLLENIADLPDDVRGCFARHATGS